MATLDELGPEDSIRRAVERLPATGGEGADGGAIAIAKDGRLGWAHNSPAFAVAYVTDRMEAPRAFLNKDEERSG